MSLLLVHEDPEVCCRTQALLAADGFEPVYAATSVYRAYQRLGLKVSDEPPPPVDAVVAWIGSQPGDFVSLCRAVKSTVSVEDTPIILVEEPGAAGAVAAAEKEGLRPLFEDFAFDYLSGPVSREQLAHTVRRALSVRRELNVRRAREQRLFEALRQLHETNRSLERLSTQDELTGVANRRHFDQTLEQCWQRAGREQSWLSLVLFDVDHFKRFNDQHGHQVGDDCLRAVGRVAKGVFQRRSDLVARYGGEEFAVILSNTPVEDAVILAENLRQAVEQIGVASRELPPGVGVTISLGVSGVIPSAASTSSDLVRTADQALYQAKRSGRNRVSFELVQPLPSAEPVSPKDAQLASACQALLQRAQLIRQRIERQIHDVIRGG